MYDPIEKFETLTDGQKTLVGLYQEVRLSQDEDGGEDGMWFNEAVQEVTKDQSSTIAFVATNWPHGKVNASQVKAHCAL